MSRPARSSRATRTSRPRRSCAEAGSAQWFRPQHVEHRLTIGLDAALPHTKGFLLTRTGGRDFTERDCAVLDALRPYLGARYALWEARHRLDVEPLAAGPDPLTAREREIVALVRAGLTNAEIAVRLSIAPGTVRRHLENVYGKLGVHTRTAAVAKLRLAKSRGIAPAEHRAVGEV